MEAMGPTGYQQREVTSRRGSVGWSVRVCAALASSPSVGAAFRPAVTEDILEGLGETHARLHELEGHAVVPVPDDLGQTEHRLLAPHERDLLALAHGRSLRGDHIDPGRREIPRSPQRPGRAAVGSLTTADEESDLLAWML